MNPRHLLLAAGAGGIFPFALSPFHYYPLGPLSVATLLLLWHRCERRHVFAYGYVYGLCLFGVGVAWIHISLHRFGNMPLPLAWALNGLLVAFLALSPALAGWLTERVWARRDGVRLLLVAPACLVLLEWVRGWIFTGFPWLNFGLGLSETPLLVWAPIAGLYGLSLLLVTGSAALLQCLTDKARTGAMLTLVLIGLGTAGLQYAQWTTPVAAPPVDVSLVQGAVPQRIKWRADMLGPTLTHYLELSGNGRASALLVWPETAIPAFYQQVRTWLDSTRAQHLGPQTLLVSGLLHRSAAGPHNSVLLSDDYGARFYHKRHLVPFGEYIPLHGLLAPVLERFALPMSDLRPPADTRAPAWFDTAHGRLGLSLCYEITFGNVLRKALPEAELLLTLSNDAWFGDSLAPHQHLQIARMRAAETGRYLLRATNNGITAIIDDRGRISKRLPQFSVGTLHAQVPRRQGSTPYVLLGDWPLIGLLVLNLLILWRIQHRRRQPPSRPC